MKISELPIKLQELAELRAKEQGKKLWYNSLSSSFTFAETPEGGAFWYTLVSESVVPEDECYKPYLNQIYEIY